MLYAWSCEANYFVEQPRNAFEPGKPVRNVISASDPFFSQSNDWLGNPGALGHCGAALKDRPQAAVLLAPSRVYQRMDRYLQQQGRGIRMPTVEIYEPSGSPMRMGVLTVEMPE